MTAHFKMCPYAKTSTNIWLDGGTPRRDRQGLCACWTFPRGMCSEVKGLMGNPDIVRLSQCWATTGHNPTLKAKAWRSQRVQSKEIRPLAVRSFFDGNPPVGGT
jgi:hypothetical protein